MLTSVDICVQFYTAFDGVTGAIVKVKKSKSQKVGTDSLKRGFQNC